MGAQDPCFPNEAVLRGPCCRWCWGTTPPGRESCWAPWQEDSGPWLAFNVMPLLEGIYDSVRAKNPTSFRGFSLGVLWQSFQRGLFIRYFNERRKHTERKQIHEVLGRIIREARNPISAYFILWGFYRYGKVSRASVQSQAAHVSLYPFALMLLQLRISCFTEPLRLDITAQVKRACSRATAVSVIYLQALLGFWIVNAPVYVQMLRHSSLIYLYKRNSLLQ